ncbi:MAG: hypothetical protein WDO72_02280 [Pseudomonadota bacterium]
MNFQEKVLEATAELRSRAAKRVEGLKGSLATLSVASREFNKVARRHVARFVKENSTIAVAAGKDVSALARTTFATLAKRPAAKTTRKPPARKRSSAKAA